jgi:hypothetical protein
MIMYALMKKVVRYLDVRCDFCLGDCIAVSGMRQSDGGFNNSIFLEMWFLSRC